MRSLAAVPGTSAAGLAGVVRPQTSHADRPDGQGKTVRSSNRVWPRRGQGLAKRLDAEAVSCSLTGAPMPTPPYQFIAIARTIARGFTEQAIGRPDGEALTEAARAIWRGIEVLEGMDRRERPGVARSMRSVQRALSTAPVPAR
jgi:hypothetical protein